jgi:hypothetical protein
MFVRLTDGRVAYTDNDAFVFILTEPVFSALADYRPLLPLPASLGPDSIPPAKTRSPGAAN